MTIAVRNRTLIAYITVSLMIFIGLVVFTVLTRINGGFEFAEADFRALPFFKYNTLAVIISIYALVIYVSVAGLAVYFMFEKTRSSEIIYFSVFLFACLFESLRFCILLYSTANIYSNFILFASRGIFFGRICTSLTFLFASIFCGDKLEHDPERTCYLIFAAGVVAATLIPFNTTHVASNAMLTYGFMNRIFFIRILFACITFFSFFINGVVGEIFEFKGTAYGFLLLYSGYLLLTVTDNIPSCAAGIILLAFGTRLFLNNLHRYYLWK